MCIFFLSSLKVQSFPLPRRLTSSVNKTLANTTDKMETPMMKTRNGNHQAGVSVPSWLCSMAGVRI